MAGRKRVSLYETPHPRLARPRVCLRCDRTFASAGPQNRICPTCQRKAQGSPSEIEPYQLILALR
jgi:tRNA(Ile2) C34 agmatinyltransferase TiaS